MPYGLLEHSLNSKTTRIRCYENEVPPFAAAEIDRLYGHILCSVSNFQVSRQLDGASTYVVWNDDVITTVLLYLREAREVTVISEFIELSKEEISRFVHYFFTNFESIRVISFRKLRAESLTLPYPHHVVNCTEDFVVHLPQTVEEYQAKVGKNMRRNIKRYTTTLEKDFPSYRYEVFVETEIEERRIRDIIDLNRTRMAEKNIVSRIDEEETQWIADLARTCGIMGVATIDGKVCGGAIGFRIGQNYFMHVIAHDPRYNDYSLGIICYYFTICEGIARGGKRFHLLPGRYEYKFRLLGELQEIAQVDIYRDRTSAAMNAGRIARTAFNGVVREGKLWLLDAERRDDFASRYAAKAVRFLRNLKRGHLISAAK
jgi:CelD/BcsL family acetyltransferase involved in cellulose biosynthesis